MTEVVSSRVDSLALLCLDKFSCESRKVKKNKGIGAPPQPRSRWRGACLSLLPVIVVDGSGGGTRMDGRKVIVTILGVVATLATAGTAMAQGRGAQSVPSDHRPPAGLCRVWYDGVPPSRQPPPISCRDAERRAGPNARVIYGERGERLQNDRWDDRRSDGRQGGDWGDRDDGRRGDGGQFRRDGRFEDSRGEPGRSRVGSNGRNRTGNSSASSCAYLDPNGRCVRTGRRDMPMMSHVNTLQRSQRSQMERYWLGDGAMTARYVDRDRNGVPEEILWYDRRGALVQRWQDSDRDGWVDEIVIYRDGVGRVVR